MTPAETKEVIQQAKTAAAAWMAGNPKAGHCPYWDEARSTLWRSEFDLYRQGTPNQQFDLALEPQ